VAVAHHRAPDHLIVPALANPVTAVQHRAPDHLSVPAPANPVAVPHHRAPDHLIVPAPANPEAVVHRRAPDHPIAPAQPAEMREHPHPAVVQTGHLRPAADGPHLVVHLSALVLVPKNHRPTVAQDLPPNPTAASLKNPVIPLPTPDQAFA
jgi:hypothetical protein